MANLTREYLNYQKVLMSHTEKLSVLSTALREQILSTEGSSSMSEHLKVITKQKETVFSQLQTLYAVKRKMAEGNALSLVTVKGLKNSLEETLGSTEELIKKYHQLIYSKKRMNEIADYQYNKYVSYKRIMKLIVYTSIISILIGLLVQQPWFPKLVGKGVLVIVWAYLFWQIGGVLVWNFRRDDRYWHKFRQDVGQEYDPETGEYGLSKWNHNKDALKKIWDNVGGTEQICKNITNIADNAKDDYMASLQPN